MHNTILGLDTFWENGLHLQNTIIWCYHLSRIAKLKMDSSLKNSFLSTRAAERICKMILYQSKCFSEFEIPFLFANRQVFPPAYLKTFPSSALRLWTYIHRGYEYRFPHRSFLKPLQSSTGKTQLQSQRIFSFNKINILSSSQKCNRKLLTRDNMVSAISCPKYFIQYQKYNLLPWAL